MSAALIGTGAYVSLSTWALKNTTCYAKPLTFARGQYRACGICRGQRSKWGAVLGADVRYAVR